ncbi:MAG: HU family DNA-binding protein, partial [Gammaproteobacteria bacterium]|nr:HU family DNA-binding protein [Gammaproteobacteria bacterium]
MNKTELVREIAAAAGETQMTVAKIVNETLKAISHSLKKGEPVT